VQVGEHFDPGNLGHTGDISIGVDAGVQVGEHFDPGNLGHMGDISIGVDAGVQVGEHFDPGNLGHTGDIRLASTPGCKWASILTQATWAKVVRLLSFSRFIFTSDVWIRF